MKKRRIAAWTAACMLLTLVSSAAFAWEETEAQSKCDVQTETEIQAAWDPEASEEGDAGLVARIEAYMQQHEQEHGDAYSKADDGTLVIVIDAGHGGKDSGGERGSVLEKTLNLKIAQACRDALNEYRGVKVYMTREGDTYPTLDERVQMAIDVDADLMVSIHNNIGGACGAEALVSNGNYNPAPHAQCVKVANSILQSLNQRVGVKNRGLIMRNGTDPYPDGSPSDYYHIVRGCVVANIVGMIIENGYMDSSDYNNYLSSDAKLKKLGEANAAGIAQAYGLQFKSAAASSAQNGDTPFIDVYEDEWFYPAVTFAYQNKLMNGTSATTFEPKGTTTRAMAAQILYNYACSRGAVSMEGGKTFEDVRAGAWYAEALQWASANGVVKGVSETRFNPNGKVTRQEFVSMLCRYVGGEASSSASLDSFPDANQAAQWAHTELCWAVENGVINGVKDSSGVLRLNPTGTATRAEIAQLMKNYMERI